MSIYVIHPLAVGINETDQGIMTYQRGYGKRIWLPIYVFYLEGGDQKILVDTGMEEFMISSRAVEETGLSIMNFEEALSKVDLTPENVDIVIQTHLHNDHCENTYKCKNAKVYVQQAELDFFKAPHPIDHRYYSDLLNDSEVVPVEGDVEIISGVRLLFTPGHTPGGQSVAVSTEKGTAIITGFCCNAENFPKVGPVVAPGVHTDAIAAYESAKRVKEMADILIPNHAVEVGLRHKIPE
ncbi:MAG: N-acyl homoserine lactonase family protein [Deltaproteobacteria bacterium]|nr:N-acyl homoserine lactonase family protein [Deltaproteobacteria bacterium]MBW2071799.1 N-acyl homoserine lactonase family protein [Deltaproteobacteria bacterium]